MPYFLVRKKDLTAPTGALIHAYGGFNARADPDLSHRPAVSLGPARPVLGRGRQAFVLANIRGGGEYGPAWHRGALREKRQNSFDDLEAVARDLMRAACSRGGIGRDFRPLERRRAGRRGDQPAPRPLCRDDRRFALVRHEALFASARGRLVDFDEYGDPDKPADWAFMIQIFALSERPPGRAAIRRRSSIFRPRTTGSIRAMRARWQALKTARQQGLLSRVSGGRSFGRRRPRRRRGPRRPAVGVPDDRLPAQSGEPKEAAARAGCRGSITSRRSSVPG